MDDIWCVRVENAKTRASERTVPLHPAIIRQGFLDHVQAQGCGRLFGEKAASNNATCEAPCGDGFTASRRESSSDTSAAIWKSVTMAGVTERQDSH